MVNVDVAGGGPGGTVVGADPGSAGGSAGRAGDNVGAVALEDGLTGVASAGDGDPVGEKITVVRVGVGPGTDGQGSKLGLGRGSSRNARLRIVSGKSIKSALKA